MAGVEYYRHFKGGHYRAIGEAEHTETGERLVLYQKAEELTGQVWARPYDMFHGTTEDGTPRFQKMERCPDCGGDGKGHCKDPQCGDSTWDHYCGEGGTCSTCKGVGGISSE